MIYAALILSILAFLFSLGACISANSLRSDVDLALYDLESRLRPSIPDRDRKVMDK